MNNVLAREQPLPERGPDESRQEPVVDHTDEPEEEVREKASPCSAPLYLGGAVAGSSSPLNGNGRNPSPIRSLQRSYGNMATLRCFDYVMQKKMKVGERDDVYEREADRIAEQVLKIPERTMQRTPT
jgi:hypothetical protein